MHSKHVSLFGGKMRGSLYELNFLLNLAIAVIAFYLSVFASSIGIKEFYLGLMYSVGSALSILALTQVTKIIEFVSVKKALLLSSALYCVSLFLIAFSTTFTHLLLAYAIMSIALIYTVCILDMYVSENSEHNHNTGKVRGVFLAVSNIAYVVGPFIGGILVQIGGFSALYLAAAAFLMPFIAIVYERMPNIRSLSHVHSHSLKKSLLKVWRTPQLREVFIAQSTYRKFIATFNVYAALYLTQVAGLSFFELGIVLTFFIIPYVIVEFPLGKMLDSNWSERTPALIGFFIMALCASIIPSIATSVLAFWCIIFFILGIGGGLVELSLESYFFKHIHASNEEAVAAFRALYPMSYLLGPITGSVLFYWGGYELLFFILVCMLLYGAKTAYTFE